MYKYILPIAIILTGCNSNTPLDEVIKTGKAAIAANKACADDAKKHNRVSDKHCKDDTMAAMQKYNDAKLKLTEESPAAKEIEKQVWMSNFETLDALMKVK